MLKSAHFFNLSLFSDSSFAAKTLSPKPRLCLCLVPPPPDLVCRRSYGARMRSRPDKKAAAAAPAQVGTRQEKAKDGKDGGSDEKIGKATAKEKKLKAQEIREEAEEIESGSGWGSGSGSDYDEEEQESGSGSGSDIEEEEISSGGSDSDSEEENDSVYDSGEGEEYESGSDDEECPKIDRSDVLEDEDDGEGLEAEQVEEESDSSEDEVAPRNTIGDVPFEWYEDEEHVGYNISGKKIRKSERQNKLDSFLQNKDDSKNWLKVHDAYNDEVVDLSKDEYKMLHRIIKGQAPHANFDPYPDYVDWFKWDDAKHPLSNAPEPKRRFTPSKWEAKKVVKLIRAIRKGLIKVDEPKEEPHFYNLWEDDSSSASTKHLSYIPPPKPKLPGHDESYNPSLEYIPTQEEINSYQLMDEEDRPTFIPKRFTSLRSIPAYENVKDSFERCLDLYLCPRVRKKRLNIDPESLKPKLPSRKDLKPYPTVCYIEYRGHKGAVMSISTESSGQWIASGSMDGTVRVWEVETGRCLKVWEFGEAVQCVAWNPMVELPILAVSVGQDVFLLNTGLGNGEIQKGVEELLCVKPIARDNSDDKANAVSWLQDEKHGGIRLTHFKTVSSVQWHRRGDYFSVVIPAGQSRSILIHKLSKNHTLTPGWKLHGLAVSSAFHPTRSIFFVATKNHVRVYNLLKEDRDKMLMKKLETGLREVSSISVHPGGDNLIVGSKEGKLCWFDIDLSSKPYRVINCHPKDITNVAFHRSYPLFASCSDDCTAYVFHGMVPADLNENPLIVPLEILRGHTSSNGRGIMDCKFHPRQPWLFTAGADSLIKLYCH